MNWDLFVSMLLLVFAIGMLIAGIFTAYFGSGKSRAIGGVLFIIGIIIAIVFYNYSEGALWITEAETWGWDTVADGITAVIGAVIGALIALGVFLAGIMKA